MSLRYRLLLSVSLLASGCAFDAGEPFATVKPTVATRFDVPESAKQADGFVRLQNGFEVRLDRALFTFGALQLEGPSDGSAGAPAETHCHGANCGAGVEPEIGETNVHLEVPIPAGLDAVKGDALDLACDPSCALDRVEVHAVELTLTHVALSGVVRGGPSALAATPWTVDTAADPNTVLEGDLDLISDEAHFPHVELTVTAPLSPDAFEAVDFAALVATNDQAAREALVNGIAATELETEVTRRP